MLLLDELQLTQGTSCLTSDLAGLAIDLPLPLGKTSTAKKSFKLTMLGDNLSTIKLEYAGILQADFVFTSAGFNQGLLQFGNSAATVSTTSSSSGLQITGNLKSLDLQNWLRFFATSKHLMDIPLQVDVTIDSLNLLGMRFAAVRLHCDMASKTITLGSDNIAGTIKLATDPNTITADFSKLVVVNDTTTSKTSKLLREHLPKLNFSCGKLVFKDNVLGQVNFTLQPTKAGYDILDLAIQDQNFILQGHGKWQLSRPEICNITGMVNSDNFGKAFAAWGLGNSIVHSNGEMQFDFTWPGNLTDFKLTNSSGNVNLALKAGKIRGVNPGLGRIIGLLSLDNIQRRLKLDFSDFLGSGFVFDKLQASFVLKAGNLHTEGVFIDGPSAYIALIGDADITSKKIDCKMGVVPKVGASLPLAAAITAGNPAIGAAFWIFNKATSAQAKSTNDPHYRYSVTGTWDNPKIIDNTQSK